MTITKESDLRTIQLHELRPIINQDEIVAGAVHLSEFQDHVGQKLQRTLQRSNVKARFQVDVQFRSWARFWGE